MSLASGVLGAYSIVICVLLNRQLGAEMSDLGMVRMFVALTGLIAIPSAMLLGVASLIRTRGDYLAVWGISQSIATIAFLSSFMMVGRIFRG